MSGPWHRVRGKGELLVARRCWTERGRKPVDKRFGLGHARTRVNHMHEHQRFDDAATTWDDDPGHERRQVSIAQAIKEAVHLSPRMSAVDVGGGTGRLSILLADLVGSVVVTDPSAGMVRVARERIEGAGLGDRLRAVQADLTTDGLDGAYDVVWSSMALHHVQDLDGLLRILTRIRTAPSTPTRSTSPDITGSTGTVLPSSWAVSASSTCASST
jgi:2-polyprenyl-3-methyl-5-hydroxy-6-metoxy-1,4-benzoquinol methylase